jgi:hypothetical protein
MSVKKYIGRFGAAALLALGATSASAEPTSAALLINQLRPYIGDSVVYVYPNGQGPCGSSSPTNIYTIDLTTATGKAAYAAALAAMAAGKHVLLEVQAGQCTATYAALQSIYALPN